MPSATENTVPIPQPPTQLLQFNTNLADIDPHHISASFKSLASLYGPIFALQLSNRIVVCSNRELVDEVSDEKRFRKFIGGALGEVRNLALDGLFTAYSEEPNWKLAHKLLMPVFGPMKIASMLPGMLDIASQLLLKWDRFGPNNVIDVTGDFTRLTLDTIALCSFDYRFNSFYSEAQNPFIEAMVEVLEQSGLRSKRTPLEKTLRIWSNAEYWQKIREIEKLCADLIKERKENPRPEVNDLLNVMLSARDEETGQGLSDDNIMRQMITFLIAGHETTSGLLSFVFYSLLKNPSAMQAATAEVDKVLGDKPLGLKDIPNLKYIDAILKESLRLYPTAPAFSVSPVQDTIIGGKYKVTTEDSIVFNLPDLHRDFKVWGEDAEQFRPERMLNGGFEKLPPNAWKPFGNGARGCIGRAFAWQESLALVALILQHFVVEMAEPDYELQIKQQLTIKPQGFHMKVHRRSNKQLQFGLGQHIKVQEPMHKSQPGSLPDSNGRALSVFYGSNAGTCKNFAESVQSSAREHDYTAKVSALDKATDALPTDHPVIIISPSYEGQPADNAKKFVSWLDTAAPGSLKGVKYAVFGVGNSDWVNTYHKVPKYIDATMESLGAERLLPLGLANVAGDLFGNYEEWSDQMWETIAKGHDSDAHKSSLKVDYEQSEIPEALGEKSMRLAKVLENKQIAPAGKGTAKRHMAVELPNDVTYQTGDYLVVLPKNHPETVRRVLSRFGIVGDNIIKLSGTKKSFLPKTPERAYALLAGFVELGYPISKKQVQVLADATEDPTEKAAIEKLGNDEVYESKTLANRTTILDILEDFRGCGLEFAQYLDMLQPLKPRQYSVSSSPIGGAGSNICTISYDVTTGDSLSGHGTFYGVASTYLASHSPGSFIHCFIRSTSTNFHLPLDPSTPIIMIATGTGLAPMRGFIQERAAQAKAGKTLGPALFYYGCHDPEVDYIYKDELERWEEEGVVEMRPVFSFAGKEEGKGEHVGDRIWEERAELARLFKEGAKIFLCGSARRLGYSIEEVVYKIYMDSTGKDIDAAKAWLLKQKEDRYVTDVFG